MASYFSWTRAAYVFFVLSLLAALLKIGGSSFAEPRSFVYASPNEPEEITAIESTTAEQTAEQTVERVQERQSDSTVAQTTVSRPPRPAPAVRIRNDAPAGEDPPVFYRPSARVPGRDTAERGRAGVSALGTGPACGDLGDLPKGSKAIFPLADTFFDSYSDTWGAPRPQGGHEGADLMTPFNTPEYAITDGTIVPVSGADDNGWNTLGGYTVMLRADYDVGPIKAGDLFYYAHMNRESTLKIGTRVRAGQVVGVAGDTGNGPPVTRGTMPSHLHFGWYDASGARTNLDSGAMNPYPLLEWLKANGGAVAGGSDVEYCEAPQPPAPVPSTGGNTWTYPTFPGTRPDIDTGTGDARPSPAMEKPVNSAEEAPGVEKEQPPPRREAPADEEDVKKPATPEAPQPEVGVVKPPVPPDNNAPRVGAPRTDIEGPVDRRPPIPPSVSSIRDWVTDLLNPAPRDGDRKKRPERGQDSKDKIKPDKRQKAKPDRPKRPRPPAPKIDVTCEAPGAARPCEEDTAIEETTREETTPPETTESIPEGTTPAPPESESTLMPEATQSPEPTSAESSNESASEPAPEGTTPR